MVEQWNSDGGTGLVNSESGGSVGGTVMVEQWKSVEQCWWNSGTVIVEQ